MKVLYQSSSYLPSLAANSVHVMNMVDEINSFDNIGVLLGFLSDDKSCSGEDIHSYYGVNNQFPVFRVSGSSKIGKLYYCFYSLFFAFKFKPDLIISRYYPGVCLLLLFGYRVVYDVHAPFWKQGKLKALSWNLFKKFKSLRVSVNSNALKSMFVDDKVSPLYDITVAFNGAKKKSLNKGFFTPEKNSLNVGYVGGIYQGRGIELLLGLAGALPNVTFHIAGGSTQQLDALKSKHSLSNNLVFYGHIAPAETYRFRNSCDVLLAPYSKNNVFSHGKANVDQSKYQNPIKIIEYLSAKKIIIASDIPTIRELLDDDSSLLLDPDCVDDWIQTIGALANGSLQANEKAEKAYSFFCENLTWSKRAVKLLNCFKSDVQ